MQAAEWRSASIQSRWPVAVIDWGVLVFASYFVVPIPILLAGLRGWACLAVSTGIMLMAMTFCWARGWTPGMPATGVRLVRANTGGRPGVLRAAIRVALVFPGASGCIALLLIVYSLWMGHYPSGAQPAYNWERTAILMCIASTYLGMALFCLRGPAHQTAYDRLLGLRVLEPVRPAPIARPQSPPSPARPPKPPRRRISRWWLGLVALIALWESIALMAFAMILAEPDFGGAAVCLILFVGAPGWVAFEVLRRVFAPGQPQNEVAAPESSPATAAS